MAKEKESNQGKRKLYYISAEFLIGKLLSNNLINLGIYEDVKKLLADNGMSLAESEEVQPEPSLGNGGLGRLAACFLDSIASLGLNGDGVGLNYHYGLFKQVFKNNLQNETPNPWIEKESWLTKTDVTYPIQFGGFTLQSRLYDIDVIGYENRTTKLHLFDVETVDESLVGEGIDFDKEDIAKNLTLFLYPDDSDDKGRILIPFNNLINDTYCRDISMRVRSHLDVKRKEGQFIGSFAGYGYQKDPKDKNHLIIDEYAAGIVQEIFKQKLNGMSSQRIASHLNELGVLPPNEYKRANGFNYTCGFQAGLNQKWTVVSVNRILKNESYTGTLIQGKRRKINYKVKKSHDVGSENWIRVEDAHDAIISKGEFQQVQQLLELDTRTAPSQTTVYPLSGFLRCADCGQNMIRRTVTKNGKKYQYYHCSTYKNGGGCTPHMINSEKLTESVLTAIRHQVSLLVEAEKVLSNAELASGEQIGIKILDSQITALEAELERYSNLKIRLYQDLCDDVVSREEYGEMNTRFAQKIKEAQDKIQEIREKKQEALKHDTLLPTWLEEFKQYEHIKTLERRVVVELIDHIDVHSKTEIEIHFCFEDELHSITEKFMEYQAHHGNEVAEE